MSIKPVKTGANKPALASDSTPEEKEDLAPPEGGVSSDPALIGTATEADPADHKHETTTAIYANKDGDLAVKVGKSDEVVIAKAEFDLSPEDVKRLIELPEKTPTRGYSGAGSSTTFVKCKAIRTVLGRGLPHYPGEEFYQFEDAALEAAERGDLEIL